MARKKHQEHVNHERWLVSYADFITLLFAFFVVMFASSQTDRAKAQQVSDSVKSALEKGATHAVREVLGGTVDDKGKGNAQMRGPGGAQKAKTPDVTAELLPSMRYLTKALDDEIKQGKLELHLESRGLVLSLREATFFPSGEDAVDPKTFTTLEKIAVLMRDLPNPVRLEGHTDPRPIHTLRFHNNWVLSAARAIAMLELLSTRYNIASDRLAIAGYADTKPIVPNDTPEGMARNRRVDVVILNQEVRANSDQPTADAHKAAPPKTADAAPAARK
jgi:chemotaxis protein MotB